MILERESLKPGRDFTNRPHLARYVMSDERFKQAAKLLRSKSLDMKRAGLRSLATLGTPEALELLGEIVESGQPPIADEGLSLLADISGEKAVHAMGAGLLSPDPFWRTWVLYALGKRKESEALIWILKSTTDENPRMRQMAVGILNRAAKKNREQLVSLKDHTIGRIFRVLDKNIVLRFIARDCPTPLRLGVIRWLGEEGGDNAATILVSVCSGEDEIFRKTAISSLERLGHFVPEIALPLLENTDPEIRSRGLMIFGRLAERKGTIRIEALLKDSEAKVRLAAVKCLCEVAGQDAIGPISQLLGDPDPQVRLKAVESLAGFESEKVVEFLIQAALDSDEKISRHAILALAARGIFTPELEKLYIHVMEKGIMKPELSMEEVDAFCEIVDILGTSYSKERLRVLILSANSSGRRLRRRAITAIDAYPYHQRLNAMRQLADTDDLTVLQSVALGLGEARDPKGVIPLIRATMECPREVSRNAREFLERLADVKKLPFLIKHLQSRWPSVKKFAAGQIVGMDSPELIDPLLETINDRNMDVQLVVIEAMEKFTYDKQVVNCLLKFIGKGDIALRQLAVEILGNARVKDATEPLMRVLGNKFLHKKAEKALLRIGERKGILAIKRHKIKEEFISRTKL